MLKNQNSRLGIIVVASILIHAVLIAALYFGKKAPIALPETPSIIQAELLFVDTASFLPAEASQAQEEELPAPEPEPEPEPEKPKPSPATTEEKTRAQAIISEPNEPTPLPMPEVEEQQEDQELTDDVVPNETQEPFANDTILSATEAVKSSENTIYQQPIQDVAKSQLHSLQQRQLNSLAAQAASEYRQQRDHPTIGAPEGDSFLTEEERFTQKITTSVDCSSTTNQTLAVVMGIMGGRVKCSEPPPFDSFIQKRLNKRAELPALQDKNKP